MQLDAPPRVPKTTVVNVKKDEYDVYIGRKMPGFSQSPYHNPVRLVPGKSREECLEQLREHWLKSPELIERMRRDLLGKRVGCWCDPELCHGHLIIELIEGIPVEEQRRKPKPPQLSLF